MTKSFDIKKVATTIAAIVVSTTIIYSFAAPAAFSQGNLNNGVPFGGFIQEVDFCPCTANFWLRLGGPSAGNYIYQPGFSEIHPKGQVTRPGAFLIGRFAPGGAACLGGATCEQAKPANGTITVVGTSD